MLAYSKHAISYIKQFGKVGNCIGELYKPRDSRNRRIMLYPDIRISKISPYFDSSRYVFIDKETSNIIPDSVVDAGLIGIKGAFIYIKENSMHSNLVYAKQFSNQVSSNLPTDVDSFLHDMAQWSGLIDYNDIIEFGKRAAKSDIDAIKKLMKKFDPNSSESEMKDLAQGIIMIMNPSNIKRPGAKQTSKSGKYFYIVNDKDQFWSFDNDWTLRMDEADAWSSKDDAEKLAKKLGKGVQVKQFSNDLSDVGTHSNLPEGTFTKSAKEIVDTLLKYSEDRIQAIRRINFYINRAGDTLSNADEVRKAKEMLEAEKQESKMGHKYAYVKQFSKPNFLKDIKEDKFYILAAPNRISGDIEVWVIDGDHINRFYMGEPLPANGFYYDSKAYNSYEDAAKVAKASEYEFVE